MAIGERELPNFQAVRDWVSRQEAAGSASKFGPLLEWIQRLEDHVHGVHRDLDELKEELDDADTTIAHLEETVADSEWEVSLAKRLITWIDDVERGVRTWEELYGEFGLRELTDPRLP